MGNYDSPPLLIFIIFYNTYIRPWQLYELLIHMLRNLGNVSQKRESMTSKSIN